MEISVTVKQLGRKHPLLNEEKLSISSEEIHLPVENLIRLIVLQQVDSFNAQSFEQEDLDSIKTPGEDYLNILTDTGKAGFGSIYNERRADPEKAQENAIQAFEDGLYAIFYGDEELKDLKQEIDLSQGRTFVFIRLTFLAGSYW
ncbi:hypothetical protein [uncultured Chryseobacterium sp.]|uniref:hypothetical protein n=1 Tax=uncultured Chryseobacterium sp. TaxID=259322 RepID=UPI0025D9B97A|nr:hypothetical protein [uncultured Chryseobacterium sp.]